MGIYADITAKVGAAFDTKLSDAVKLVTVIAFDTPDYDLSTGNNVSPETSYTTRGVVESISEEVIQDEPTLMNGVSILILDAEKQVPEFVVGSKILVDNDPQTYKLLFKDKDPANATHSLQCGRWS